MSLVDDKDPFRLRRFVDAQALVYQRAREELRKGQKASHWMWFIFPQRAGLGTSGMSQRYAISSVEEAKAYLAHPVLGPRLEECVRLVNTAYGRSVDQIFGYPDNLKFRSSMELFSEAAPDNGEFQEALKK